MKIEILKPFSEINYKGYITPPAFISFGKEIVGRKDEDIVYGVGRSVVLRYRYELKIDLWLIKFYFQWEKIIIKPNATPRQ